MSEEKVRVMGIREYVMNPMMLGDRAVIIRKVLDEKT
jgi:hypothetical protein